MYVAVNCWTGMLSSDSEQTASATSSSSKLKPRVTSKVINCVCDQSIDTTPLTQVMSRACCHMLVGLTYMIACRSVVPDVDRIGHAVVPVSHAP